MGHEGAMPKSLDSRANTQPMVLWAVLTLAVLFALSTSPSAKSEEPEALWYGTDDAGQPTIRFFLFWSATCPHCRRAIPFVQGLDEELPWLEVHPLPLTDRPENVELYLRMTGHLGYQAPGVPTFIFCGRMEVGFDTAETTGAYLRQRLIDCRRHLIGELEVPAKNDGLAPVEVPLLGTIDPTETSLPVFTVLIAGLDAFNPCAFFVLMFLLSLLVHARDRIRMAVIGCIFVLTSGIIYFVFMAAWLNVFLFAGELRWVTMAAAVVAIVLAAINIKDYIWFRKGVSLSIAEGAKPGLFARMRTITLATSWPALLLGAITLAIAANTYELLCTAGFPMLFTRVLTLNELPSATYYLYLVLYNVVYVVPLLGIATIFVVTLGSRKLQETEGRTLKLLSGLMMLGLGAILLIEPDWLSDVRVAAGILAAAIGVTTLIAGLTRVLRVPPR